jgi:hypothetical protein
MSKILDFVLTLIHEKFDQLYLLALFFGGAVMIARWPDNDKLIQWVTAGAVIGAILMLVTGKKEEK